MNEEKFFIAYQSLLNSHKHGLPSKTKQGAVISFYIKYPKASNCWLTESQGVDKYGTSIFHHDKPIAKFITKKYTR